MNGDALVFEVAHSAGPTAGATCDACNGSRLCWICRGTGDHGGQQCGNCWGSGRCPRCGGTGIYMARAERDAGG